MSDNKDNQPGKFKAALCQLHIGTDKAANLKTASDAVKTAKSQGAELVMLPEMFNCPYSNDSFPVYAEPLPTDASTWSESESPSAVAITNMAKDNGVWLVAGSIPEKEEGKLYNTCLVVDPTGKVVAKHRKVHLFDIDIPGKMTFKESETLTPGNGITTFDSPWGKIGVGICYDLRFPEYAMLCAQRGCVILAYPGAFNTTTGPMHWELLQRGRAVDNQLYVMSCSPARNPESKYQAWGHSTVVSPWGQVVATTEHEPGIVYAEVDVKQVSEMRTNIPVRSQKRHDLYQLVDKTA